jgi:hypothetical protein
MLSCRLLEWINGSNDDISLLTATVTFQIKQCGLLEGQQTPRVVSMIFGGLIWHHVPG